MKKIQNKSQTTNTHKTILATLFAFVALAALYLLVASNMRGTIAPTRDIQDQIPSSSQVQITETQSKSGIKTFRSDFMKIEFEYPNDATIIQNINFLDLKRGVSGHIRVSVVASNFTDSKDHIDYLISKMPNARTQVENVLINGLSWATVNFNENEELVYFYVNKYTSYQLSTKDPALFPDLETIAKSFKILE